MSVATALTQVAKRAAMLAALLLSASPVWGWDRQAAKDDPLFYKHELVEQAQEKYAVCLVR